MKRSLWILGVALGTAVAVGQTSPTAAGNSSSATGTRDVEAPASPTGGASREATTGSAYSGAAVDTTDGAATADSPIAVPNEETGTGPTGGPVTIVPSVPKGPDTVTDEKEKETGPTANWQDRFRQSPTSDDEDDEKAE
jgi:hypothetical protein